MDSLKKIFKTFLCSMVLLLILILYSFAGAILFQLVESPHETHEKSNIIDMREDIVGNVLNSSHYGHKQGARGEKFEAELKEELKRYEAQLYAAFAQGINSDSEEEVWDLWGSLIYCTTVYTTVGYGHIYPTTNTGRILTMAYGLVGIPLCLIVLTELGKLFTMVLKFVWSFFHSEKTKTVRKTVRIVTIGDNQEELIEEIEEEVGFQINDEFNLPPIIAIIISVIYIFGGALMYMQWEDWDYLEAFYFIFISVSTVGFGDVLPGQKEYFLLSFIYQLFGLALVAMVINVVMEVVQGTLDKAANVARKMGLPTGTDQESELKKTQ